ncbi:MAG: hypothetical protein FJX21_20995, partial [Alphaproteobacteria bacterium]|nr:hypothetical protein [Alphaproteobacteria bacterium]
MGLVLVVNAGMVAAAISTYSGLAHDNAFGRGLAYNRLLEAQERQDGLGWRVDVELGAADGGDGARVVRVRLVDAGGAALADGRATLALHRPVERVAPGPVPLEPTGPGAFEGRVVLARTGQFDARVACCVAPTASTRRAGSSPDERDRGRPSHARAGVGGRGAGALRALRRAAGDHPVPLLLPWLRGCGGARRGHGAGRLLRPPALPRARRAAPSLRCRGCRGLRAVGGRGQVDAGAPCRWALSAAPAPGLWRPRSPATRRCDWRAPTCRRAGSRWSGR